MVSFFRFFKQKSTIRDTLLNHISQASESHWRKYFYGHHLLDVPEEMYLADPLLSSIHNAHPYKAAIQRILPGSNPEWISDGQFRTVSIDLILSSNATPMHFKLHNEEVTPLNYPDNTYVVINTTILHKIDVPVEPSYVFSLTFTEGFRNMTYSKVTKEYNDLLE